LSTQGGFEPPIAMGVSNPRQGINAGFKPQVVVRVLKTPGSSGGFKNPRQ